MRFTRNGKSSTSTGSIDETSRPTPTNPTKSLRRLEICRIVAGS
jgi:hypothetical protein